MDVRFQLAFNGLFYNKHSFNTVIKSIKKNLNKTLKLCSIAYYVPLYAVCLTRFEIFDRQQWHELVTNHFTLL